MRSPIALLGSVLCVAVVSGQQAAPEIGSIRQADLRADLHFLASDGMRGRLTDTPENRLAAEWIKSRFERLGLTPVGPGDSYYQPYNLMVAALGGENALEVAGGSGSVLRPRLLGDFYPHRFSASGQARGGLVFAGYGLKALGRDDYKGGSVAGKVVLVLDHEPGERDPASPFDGVVSSHASDPIQKALVAQAQGAAAILFAPDVHAHAGPSNFEAGARGYWPDAEATRGGSVNRGWVPRYTLAAWSDRVRIPAAQISAALAETLLASTGRTLAALGTAADTSGGAMVQAVPGIEVALTATVDRHVVPDRNVVALIEGSDPALKNELVIVGAHFDHDGADEHRVYPGADDNGSGTVGLLEIAEAYALAAASGQRPRRSVLFAAWNSEERGLLGAWAYTEAPLRPLEKIVAVLNMDMIGRNEEVPVGGGGRFTGLEIQTAESNANAVNVIGTTVNPGLRAEIERANRAIGLELKFRYDNNASNLLRRSDHWPFRQHGIPGVWVHTGLHPDYHTVYDRPEKINYAKMEKIARLVYQASWNVANR